MRNKIKEQAARALLKLLRPRFRGTLRDDLWDLFRAGPIGAGALIVASFRLGMPLSDLLLIARLRRRMDDLVKTRKADVAKGAR